MPRILQRPGHFDVGNIKGVGRICQQTFIDTWPKVAFAKICDLQDPDYSCRYSQ